MCLAQNIRYLRKIKGYSQDDIAEKLGYKSYTTIQKWEMGISEPPLKKLHELAAILNVDINDITTKKLYLGKSIEESNTKTGTKIPVLGRVAAGIPIEAIENILDYEEIPKKMASTGEHFGLQIKGDSMEPRICENDVVIVRKQSDAESGDLVVAMVNGNDATCKRLLKYENGIALIANNPLYEPMHFTNEEVQKLPVTIIGKVVELRGKF